ncbi:MAG: hemagglutinin repeat-containing protein [Pseudomonadota bacterium]
MNDRKSNLQNQSTSLNDIVQPSALRRRLAIVTLIAYIGQPIAATAEIIAAQNAAANQRPTVDATANGLPLVQIATPSAAGVSHNQYSTFNVDPSGAILNNSAAAVSTQQAGYVVGNPNLVNGSARIILNEVTSANRSQLNGYTEVAGQRAEVIIANPNGITCNGCGFINTSRGVLTTGTPVMGVGGSLDAYRVTGGDIQIGASGLNGSNLDQLDLISRSLKVNGEIWANNLNAITGANQVNHADLGVQLITGDANKPTVGIDVALLGGMYANKIHLVVTEAGVGVSSAGALAAQAGDFSLDTQGQITLTGNTTASGNLTLNSAAGINNSGTLDGRQNVQVTATGNISNSGSLTAQQNLTLNGASLNSSGTLAAGVDNNGNASQAGNVSIKTTGASAATGTNIAGGTLTITASDINLSNSFTSAQNNLALTATAGNIDLNHAQTQSIAGNADLTASGLVNNDYGLLFATQITANGANLSNQSGKIGGQGVAMTGSLLNNNGGLVEAQQLNFTLTDLSNRAGGIHQIGTSPLTRIVIGNALDNTGGWIQSDSIDFTLGANSITNDNAGQIAHAGQGTFILNSTGILSNNSGVINSQGNATIDTGSLSNQGGVISATGSATLTSQSTVDNSNGGYIGGTTVNLTANNGAVNNRGGKIEADTGLTLSAQSLDNSGGAIKILSATDGQTNATILSITTTQDIINNALNGVNGFIGSNGQLTLSSVALNNAGGSVYAQGLLTLGTSGALSNQSGFIQTDSDLNLNATGALNNQSGTIEANGANSLFSLTAASIDNTLGGRIANSGAGLTTIDGGSQIDSAGTLGGNGNLTVNAAILNSTTGGLVFAGNDLILGVTGSLTNNGGEIFAQNNLTIAQPTTSLSNTSGKISSLGNLTLNLADLNNQGQLQTSGNFSLNTAGALNNNGGSISATGSATLASQSTVDNSAGGYIGGATVTLTANNGAFNNRSGKIEADTGLTLNAKSLDNSGGAIKNLSATDAQANATILSITTTQDIVNNALNGVIGFIGSNGQLTLSSAAFNNSSGKLYAKNDLGLSSGGALNNQSGFIQTDGNLTITSAGALSNQGGTIEANGAASLFSLTAASINNTLAGRIANSGTGLTSIDGGSQIDNTSTLGGKGDVTITTALLNNTTANARIQSSGTLGLDVSGTLNNNTGGSIYAAQALNFQKANAQLNNSSADGITSSGSITIDVAAVNNAGGDILAVNDINLTANSYSGLGTVASAGNNTIKLQGAFTYYAGNKFAADGNLTLDVTGNLTNQAVLQALGTLTIKAANIDNQTTGHFNSNKTDLQVTNGGISNNGRIEGNTVQTSSLTLNNYATIIGDIVSLSIGDTLLNSGSTSVIASTTQMDLWVNNLLHNTGGAEIFSLGDLNIARNSTQDAAGNFTNLTGRIWNEGNSLVRGSSIEAGRNLNVGATTIDNLVQIGVTSTTTTAQQQLTAPRNYLAPPDPWGVVYGSYDMNGLWTALGGIYTTASRTPITAQFFAQDMIGLDATAKFFGVASEPNSGSTAIYFENISVPVSASQYSVQVPTRNIAGNQQYATQVTVLKDADIASVSPNTYFDPASPTAWTTKQVVTLKNGTVYNFDTLDKQGLAYDVTYFPGFDPNVNVAPKDLVNSPAPSLVYYEISRTNTVTTATDQFSTPLFAAARINSGANMNLNVGSVLKNQNSQIAALGDLTISNNTTSGAVANTAVTNAKLLNQATTLNQTVTTSSNVYLEGLNPCGGSVIGTGGGGCLVSTNMMFTSPGITTQVGSVSSTVTAGKKLGGNFNEFVNQATGSGTGVSGSTLGASTMTVTVTPDSGTPTNPPSKPGFNPTAGSEMVISSAPVVEPLNAGKNIAPSSNITLPTSGLYSIHAQPDQQYLVVTDPRFANYKNFVSSDYMLNRLTLDPTLTQKRLGDGFYEQRLINDQILNQTGRSTLGQYASAEDQIKALMDSGVAAAQELQLTPGISLSAEQVASLQNDIVWMEVNRVAMADGNTVEVLVPKLYLTQLHKNDLSPDGALVAASLIDINAENGITNTGWIESTIATRLQSKDIFNQGTISSAGDLMLKADNDITNKSGTISANNLWLDAGRDLINATATEHVSVGDSRLGASNTLIGSTGTISANNNLSMNAKRDLTITGALVEAGGNASLKAGRNFNMDTLQAESGSDTHTGSFEYSTRQITNLSSTIRTGGNLSMTAANDMQLTAAQLDIGKNALIAADGNLSVTAAKDSAKLENSVDGGRNSGSIRTYDETVVGSSISANGNITLRAGRTTNTGNARGGIERNGDPTQVSTGKVATKQRDDAEHTESSQERIASNNGSEVMLQPQITENRQLSIGLVEQKGLVVGIERQIEGKPNMTVDEPGQPYQNKPVAETKQAAVTEIITQPAPQSGGNLTLQSVAINSKSGQVALIAANDVNIGVTEEMHDYFSASHTSSSGFLSSSSTTTRNSSNEKTAVGSSIEGSTLAIQSGRDIGITGSDIVADGDITLNAVRDVNIAAAKNTASSSSYRDEQSSGFFSNGGLSISYGNKEQSNDQTQQSTTHTASTLGSLSGNISIAAGGNYSQQGSDLMTPEGNIDVLAKSIAITEVHDTGSSTTTSKFKQSGLTVALSSPVLSAMQTADQMHTAAKQTSSGRMKALAAANVAMSANSAYDAVNKGLDAKDGSAADKAGGISVSISLGNSSSENTSTQTWDQAQGSKLKAGGNITLRATGAGQNSNLTIQGSDVTAGGNATLEADNVINLLAAQNTASQTSTNKSSSNSVGVGFALGGQNNGFSINIAASRARGNADGNDVGYTNTHINAGNTLTLKSGGDTNMQGAVAEGNTVVADIGGDLNIASLQDTSTYQSEQKSAGFSASIPIGPGTGGFSVNASKTKVNGNYAAVQEQSGIKAGNGGYRIDVAGDVNLTGAVIAASDQAIADGKTDLNYGGTLTQTDIENHADYSAESSGFSAGVGSQLGASGGTGSDSGHQQSTTKSGIAVSTGIANAPLKNNFDADKVTANVNAQVAITQSFSQQAPKAVAKFSEDQAKDLRKQANALDDTDLQKQALLDEAAKWDEGGEYRVVLHTVSGALSGGVDGAAGAATTATAAPLMDQFQASAKATLIEQGLSESQATMLSQSLAEATSAGMGAVVGGTQGAASGMPVDTNNRQLHISNFNRLKDGCKGSSSTECQTINRMAGVKSGMPVEDSAIPSSNVVANYDANDNVVSYTILDKATNQPTMIMEPLEFAAFRNAPAGTQALMPLSPQYSLDFASAGLYASTGDSSRASEHLIAGITSGDYARDVTLGIIGAIGATAAVARPVTTTRVGRWMSDTEFDLMKNTGRVVEGAGGRTYVVNPANPNAFTGAGRGSSVYAEFNVPADALRPGSKTEWSVIPGPNVTTRLYGPAPTEPAPATCIVCVIRRP